MPEDGAKPAEYALDQTEREPLQGTPEGSAKQHQAWERATASSVEASEVRKSAVVRVHRRDGTTQRKELVDFKDDGSSGDNARITAFAHNVKKLNAIEENYYNLSNPIPLTNFFVDRPGLWLAIALLVISALSCVVFHFDWFKAAPPHERDYLVWDDPKTIDYDKSTAAKALLAAGVGGGEDKLSL